MASSSARARRDLALAGAGVLSLGACTLAGGDGTEPDAEQATEVRLLTHSNFALPDEVVAAFEEESGYTLDVVPTDGVGVLTNQLVEQAGQPVGDVAFGVDNTFAGRALAGGVFAPYQGELPAGVADYALPGDDEGVLVPADNGNVCVNVDDTWFAAEGVAPPETLADLTEPAYRDLLAVPSAAQSSPGMAFLLATIAEFGEDWPQYWEDLLANGAEVVPGWSEAYYEEFTQGGEGGDRPIVVSYDSSPAFTVDDQGGTTTSALLETCFEQVEYVGVLDGAPNPEGAQALVEFMLSPAVQEALPESMFVFPTVAGTPLPEDWASFAVQPTDPASVDPAEIDANRADWLRTWTDLVRAG